MARKVTSRRVWVSTAAAWFVRVFDFPADPVDGPDQLQDRARCIRDAAKILFFHWTTENYATVQGRSDYFHHALNSIIVAGGSTLIAMLIAVPAAWSMAFAPPNAPRMSCSGCSRPR